MSKNFPSEVPAASGVSDVPAPDVPADVPALLHPVLKKIFGAFADNFFSQIMPQRLGVFTASVSLEMQENLDLSLGNWLELLKLSAGGWLGVGGASGFGEVRLPSEVGPVLEAERER